MIRIGRVVRGAALAACFILVLELCARCDDLLTWGAPFWGDYSQERLMVVDRLGPRCRPNGQFEKWRLESHGFRGQEVAVAKPPGVIRVMVVGASETFGLYESPGQEYPAQLGRLLAAQEPHRFEVINAGCAGMSPPRIVQLLDSYLGQFHPDFVVFYPSPQFYLDDEPPRAWSGSAQTLEPEITSRLVRRVKTRLKAWLPATAQTWLRDFSIDRTVRQHEPGWVWTRPPKDRIVLFRAHLGMLVAATRRLGARPVLLTHANRFGPTLEESDNEQLVALRKFFPRASLDVFVPFERAMNEALLDQARELEVPAIDIERIVGKDPGLFADFSHFTDQGAEAIARALATEVHQLVPPAQEARSNRR